jgi:hypothetical protein
MKGVPSSPQSTSAKRGLSTLRQELTNERPTAIVGINERKMCASLPAIVTFPPGLKQF